MESRAKLRYVRIRRALAGSSSDVSVVASIVGAVLIWMIPMYAILESNMVSLIGRGTAMALSLVLLLPCCLPIWFAIRLTERHNRRKWRKRAGQRFQRLARIARHPLGRKRLPHRIVEHDLCGTPNDPRKLRRYLTSLPPGHVVICGTGSCAKFNFASTVRSAFEPIDLKWEIDRLAALIADHGSTSRADKTAKNATIGDAVPGKQTDHHAEKPVSIARQAQGQYSNARDADILTIVRIVILSLIVAALILMPGFRADLGLFVMMLALAALVAYDPMMSMFRRHTTYLIPGGIAHCTTGIGGRRAQVRRLTPENTSIVAWVPLAGDLEAVHCVLIQEGQPPIPICTHLGGLLAGWTSPLTSPSHKQLESLLNPNAR